jgi:hypothetical protein
MEHSDRLSPYSTDPRFVRPRDTVRPVSQRIACRESLSMSGKPGTDAGRAGEARGCRARCRPNGSDAKLRGQGLRGYGRAARRLPALEARDAGGVTP